MRVVRTALARIVSVTLASAITFVASVSCYAGDMMPTEMACCAAMAHHCGRMAQAHDCCTTEAPRADQGTTVARVTIASPAAVLAAILPVPLVDAARFPGSSAPLVATVKPPGIPTYLAVSSFRI